MSTNINKILNSVLMEMDTNTSTGGDKETQKAVKNMIDASKNAGNKVLDTVKKYGTKTGDFFAGQDTEDVKNPEASQEGNKYFNKKNLMIGGGTAAAIGAGLGALALAKKLRAKKAAAKSKK